MVQLDHGKYNRRPNLRPVPQPLTFEADHDFTAMSLKFMLPNTLLGILPAPESEVSAKLFAEMRLTFESDFTITIASMSGMAKLPHGAYGDTAYIISGTSIAPRKLSYVLLRLPSYDNLIISNYFEK